MTWLYTPPAVHVTISPTETTTTHNYIATQADSCNFNMKNYHLHKLHYWRKPDCRVWTANDSRHYNNKHLRITALRNLHNTTIYTNLQSTTHIYNHLMLYCTTVEINGNICTCVKKWISEFEKKTYATNRLEIMNSLIMAKNYIDCIYVETVRVWNFEDLGSQPPGALRKQYLKPYCVQLSGQPLCCHQDSMVPIIMIIIHINTLTANYCTTTRSPSLWCNKDDR